MTALVTVQAIGASCHEWWHFGHCLAIFVRKRAPHTGHRGLRISPTQFSIAKKQSITTVRDAITSVMGAVTNWNHSGVG
jgi:hypothetical protein